MPKKTKPRKTRKNKPTRLSLWLKKTICRLICLLLLASIVYVGYLDYAVRKQFSGRRWAIPAKVYANSVDIYSGYQMSVSAFEDLLQQLHYRRDYRLSSVGTYFKRGQQIILKTRRFDFIDKHQKSQRLAIQFLDTTIQKITDLNTNNKVTIFRMEPVRIGSFYPALKEDRILIKLEDTPDALVQGLLATEDREFYDHFGLSIKGIARALWINASVAAKKQGASTITQQLVKNFYLSPEKTYSRKFKEMLMALILEYRYQKNDILQAYLNEIYLGQSRGVAVHGFGLASEFYFGRPLKNLALADIATLVALVRGPAYYNPRRYSTRALKRRNLVLDNMYQQGYIKQRQALKAKQQPLNVIASFHNSVNRYPYFLDLVKTQLKQEYREEDLTSSGLSIFTTLDTHIQNTLEKTITRQLTQLEKNPRHKNLETAVIVSGRENGAIVALAGGRNPRISWFNRVLSAKRQIGSLIKPIVYLTALEYPDRYNVITPISDTAITVKIPNKQDWQPKNYDRKEHGDVPLHTALAQSYNLATVRLGMDIGVARIAKTLKNMGISRRLALHPSLLLGALELTPLEVTQMYQTLAGDGFKTPLRSIYAVMTADQKQLERYLYVPRQVINTAAAYLTNQILQEAMRQGTGKSAYLRLSKTLNLVGKTGTSNQFKDSWFAGFSGDYLAVSWVGRDDNKSSGLTGASGALKIWTALMRQITKQKVSLIAPNNIETQWIDRNGLLANEQCTQVTRYSFIKGSAPKQQSPCISVTATRKKNKTWFDTFFNQ